MSPLERYHTALQQPGFTSDPAQAAAVDLLESVYQGLVTPPKSSGLLGLPLGRKKPQPIQGAYLWGGVGRGKTFLMDLFYDALPMTEKRRTHFHRFMVEVHERRRQFLDVRDPLKHIAKEIADSTRVLCFDEFFVSDIADAMILGRLMEALFVEGVTLVATSNIAPSGLYRDGLQRQNFLPAIAILERHVRVLNVDNGVDYRLRYLTDAELYLTPDDPRARSRLWEIFKHCANELDPSPTSIELNGRTVLAEGHAAGVAWFSFAELCEGARGAADYIELAHNTKTLLLSGVPVMDRFAENAARRFITLIDELYDRNVKLVVSAQAAIDDLYQGDLLRFEFARTRSRLTEMRSAEYLAQPHRP